MPWIFPRFSGRKKVKTRDSVGSDKHRHIPELTSQLSPKPHTEGPYSARSPMEALRLQDCLDRIQAVTEYRL